MLKQIRGYNDLRLIGTGGFGEVYVGHQEVINREVAIKVILPVHANRADFIQRFRYEAELIARMEHPHIVPLYDYWRDPDGAYLVMRYVRGGNLADRLTTQGALDMVTAAKLLEQIAGALYVAHRNKVVHQDIKPANILLDEDGNAYLTDFGIARDIESNVNLAEDSENTMHGSPKYISPEHLRRKEITHRSDIYSLGILMYEVLTGHSPYESEEMLQLLQHHVRTPMPALQEKKPDLPPELNQPIQQATVKDPLSRYDNVLDFARDLQMVVTRLQFPDATTGSIAIPAGGLEADDTGPLDVFNPYKGLRAFQESDAGEFYGREALVESLRQRMVELDPLHRFLAVVGPSGSGKSSVVRAGLIPAIRRGDLDGLPTLYITDMTPGSDPMRRLEGAILKVASRATVELMETLAKDDYDLNEMLAIALPTDDEMLLVVDQFEEVFTLVSNEERRRAFLKLLYGALMADGSRLRLIVTMRADFLDRPLEYGGWGDLLRERMELVAPMKPSELRDAIEKPAGHAGLALEDGLSDTLINDVSSQAGVLPLLQYTLSELYGRREGIELTLAAYQDLGGITGALAQRAEEIYGVLAPAQQEASRLFFPRLIRLGLGRNSTRRRVLLSELYSLNTDTDAIREAIDKYGKHRLLTTDYDLVSRLPTVEVAHEALIRSWDRLNRWLRENEDDLRLQERLATEVEQWQQADKEASFLPAGMRLEQYKGLIAHDSIVLTKREHEFLDAALQLEAEHEAAARRRRQLFVALTIVIFIFGILASVAALLAAQARDAEADARQTVVAGNETQIGLNDALATRNAEYLITARIARARELASSSLLFSASVPDRAMLLSLESLAVTDTFEGRNSLLTGLLTQPRIQGFLNGHESAVRRVALSPDGALLVSGSLDGAVMLWDTSSNSLLQEFDGHSAPISGLVFSPDGHLLVTGDADGNLIVYETTSWEEVTGFSVETDDLRKVAYSPDGRWLVAATLEGRLQLWDGRDFSEGPTLEGHNGTTIYDVKFSPDSSLMVSGGADGTLHFWNTATFDLERVITAHQDWVLTLAFSPDGSRIASSGLDHIVRLWDVETGTNISAFRAHQNRVNALAFAEDGNLLISGDIDGVIVIWNGINGEFIEPFSNISQVAVNDFAVHGNNIYVAGDSHQVYELSARIVPRFGTYLARNPDEVWSVALSPSGEQIAFAGGASVGQAPDYAVYVWNADDNQVTALRLAHTLTVSDVLFYGDQIVSVGLDARAFVWADGEVNREINAGAQIASAAVYGNLLALGLNSGDIQLWDLSSESDEPVNVLRGHRARVNDLAFDADGSRLVSGSHDLSVILWDVAAGTILHEFTGHTDFVNSVAISPDGRTIASGSRDTNIILWDANTGEQLGPPLTEHGDWVMSLAFSPDGSLLASGSADGQIILWSAQEQRILGLPFSAHQGIVTTLEFDAEGNYLISGSTDGTVMRWETSLDAWEGRACQIANRSLTAAEERNYFNADFPPLGICEGS